MFALKNSVVVHIDFTIINPRRHPSVEEYLSSPLGGGYKARESDGFAGSIFLTVDLFATGSTVYSFHLPREAYTTVR
jgi:hypothetical protein